MPAPAAAAPAPAVERENGRARATGAPAPPADLFAELPDRAADGLERAPLLEAAPADARDVPPFVDVCFEGHRKAGSSKPGQDNSPITP